MKGERKWCNGEKSEIEGCESSDGSDKMCIRDRNEYCIEDTEKAIVEHASGKVIKNCIVYK